MAWVAAMIARLKRVVNAPVTWGAVWIGAPDAGYLADSEWLALSLFLIGAPALLLTLYADMRRYAAPRPSPAYEPPDRATRILMARNRRVLKDFTREIDTTGHTLH
jgi:hypothetical protein